MTAPGTILALNAGSSSLKFAVFAECAALPDMMRGAVTQSAGAAHVLAHDAAGKCLIDQPLADGGDAAALATVLALADATGALVAVGHRVVHGGADHAAPERVDPALLAALAGLIALDPLHLPHNLALIRAVQAARPHVLQVACYDTAFHHTMPLVAQQMALPRALRDAGMRRYGFHGLSCEFIAQALHEVAPALAAGRTIIAHLGAGASLCALAHGRSLASTMGLSVLDGLVMATRCGSLDPGAIFMLGRMGHDLATIEDLLYHRSGLLGLSGISGDMAVLLASPDPRAAEAIAHYVYRLALDIGAMAAALGGLDGIVFTGGVGAHAAAIRAAVGDRLGWLGLRLNPRANAAGAALISAADSRVAVRVIATDEERVIARHARAIYSENRARTAPSSA